MGFLSSLFGALGSIGTEVWGAVVWVFNALVDVANFLWSTVQIIAGYMLTVFKAIGTLFVHLWDGFFKRIFVSTFHAIAKLSTWLESHLRPIIDWLKRAQKYILDIYTKYVKPVLVMIQRIRQVLTILRALHVQWATDLDNILGKVQSDINAVFLKITGTINAVIDVLNIVTDPARFLRHPVLILSIRRSFLALIRQLTGLPPGFFFPSRKASSPTGTGNLPQSFNWLDPQQNPPPSYYMAHDAGIPSLGSWQSGVEVPDDYGDAVPILDYFNPDLAPQPDCEDGLICFMRAVDNARVRA